MMNSLDLEQLLEPIAEDAPSGPDLEYDAAFGEMERAAQGKPEQQYGDTIVAAEPPDWKEIRKHVEDLLARTRDLRVAVYLARCSLNLDGLVQFTQSLALLRGYIENFWDTLHPELDHEDNDDPTYRTNTLLTLCDEEGLLRELHETPLVVSRAIGRISLRDIQHAGEQVATADEHSSDGWNDEKSAPKPSGPTSSTIEAAFTDVALEDLQATEESIRLASEHVQAIEQQVTERVGVANAISLAPLSEVLQEMHDVLTHHLERRGVYADASDAAAEVPGEEGSSGGTPGAAGPPSRGFTGTINSRQDVIKALDSICEYYEKHEPSSPLPLLIRRARRLASKSFMEILRDLAPDAVEQAQSIVGGANDEPDDQAEASSSDW